MKKFLALSLAVLMLVTVFAGCGEKKGEEKDTLLIGASGPLTGPAASYGISVKQGAELAVEQVNAEGGVNGLKLKLEFIDDENDPQKAGVAYDTLMDKGVQASLGCVTTNPCLTFADKSLPDNLFFITASASAANVIKNKNGFRVCFGDPDQGVLAAEELVKTYTNIGVIYDSSTDYSKGVFEAFAAKMDELGKTYNAKTFDGDSNRDFSTQVAALKDCDVIFLPIYYTEAALIAQEATKTGCNAVLFGCDGLDGVAESLKGVTVNNKISYISPFDVASTDPVSSAFVTAYKAKYGKDPDQFAADGYDAIKSMVAAMVKAEVKDANISASDLCNKLYDAYTAKDFSYKGATGEMTWDANGAPVKAPIIVEIK